jgi:hypothetical protein
VDETKDAVGSGAAAVLAKAAASYQQAVDCSSATINRSVFSETSTSRAERSHSIKLHFD